ncbi:hypothetical protein DXB25_10920 [Lachnospiraceae bacterium OM02-31]|nr:hypothetical protein DXB25_10920 [Lachnospiraceae bacterium OM02-31]RJW59149.1 hypothetical protein DXB24_00275 [Lachnospiraceae bacterium OM02-3]
MQLSILLFLLRDTILFVVIQNKRTAHAEYLLIVSYFYQPDCGNGRLLSSGRFKSLLSRNAAFFRINTDESKMYLFLTASLLIKG